MKRLFLIIVLFVCFCSLTVNGQTGPGILSPRQMAKTEMLLDRLEGLASLTSTNPPYAAYRSSVNKLSTEVKEEVRKFPESDIKTDLLTALHFYERASADWTRLATDAPPRGACASERPGAYLSLCQNNDGSQRELLWSKARLHLRWARVVLEAEKGGREEALAHDLREIQAERRLDRKLGQRAVEALKELEDEVFVYRSLGEFETGRRLARVSYESFGEHLGRVSPLVSELLSRLPENSLKLELRSALYSYLDGSFRWAKVYRPAIVNVAGGHFTGEETSAVDRAYLPTDLYTVAINWRQGSLHLKRAEEILAALG